MANVCTVCGWPEVFDHCPACGAPLQAPPQRRDTLHPSLGPPRPDDHPDLRAAFTAWSQGDWPRMMGQCLVALGVERPQVSRRPRGPGWAFVQDSAAIFVAIDTEAKAITIESPVLQIPETRRVSLLRTLLELNAGHTGLARFFLRRDRVILGFAEGLANVSPPKLVEAIQDVAIRADDFDDALAIAFDAEMLGPKAQRQNPDWSFVGEPIAMALPEIALEEPPPLPLEALMETGPLSEDLWGDGPLDLAIDDPPAHHEPRPEDELVTFLDHAITQIAVIARPEAKALTERATLFHAFAGFAELCPDAINLMLARAQPLFAPGWGKAASGGALGRLANLGSLALPASGATSGEARPYLEFVFREIVASRGEVGAQAPAPLSAVRTAPEAKEHLQTVSRLAELLPDTYHLRHFVFSGLLKEVLARITLSDRMRERLELELEQQAAPSPESAFRLAQVLGRLAQ